MRVAFLTSGNGSLLQKTIENCRRGSVAADISLIIADRDCNALTIAKQYAIERHLLDFNKIQNKKIFYQKIYELLKLRKIDLVCLTFNRLISELIYTAFTCINVHLSLLPAFRGFNSLGSALKKGVTFIGSTIHKVNATTDNGPIIIQSVRPVAPFHTEKDIAQIMFDDLKYMLPQVIEWYAQNRVAKLEQKIIVKHASYAGIHINPKIEGNFCT